MRHARFTSPKAFFSIHRKLAASDEKDIELVTARAHSMKRCAAGLKVRFFSVTIATGSC
jgi:hypothetical protein